MEKRIKAAVKYTPKNPENVQSKTEVYDPNKPTMLGRIFGLVVMVGAVGVIGLTIFDTVLSNGFSGLTFIHIVPSMMIYFMPTLVASGRKHANSLAILMLNIFLGWTFLFWVVSLVWACTNNTTKDDQ